MTDRVDERSVVVMGVAGSGKTTVGAALSAALGRPFLDADDFHSERNVEKMRSGVPLEDADRWAWLAAVVRELLDPRHGGPVVLACSALKAAYRDHLSQAPCLFVYLRISKDEARRRLNLRTGHFMPPSLVDSQFAALEEPADAMTIDAERPPEQIVEEIVTFLRRGEVDTG